jgi:hypothetical protein
LATKPRKQRKSTAERKASSRKVAASPEAGKRAVILQRVKTVSKWTAVVLVALIGLLFLINAFDQDIRPEAIAFADFSADKVPDEQNAFFASQGYFAAVSDDPHRKGIEIVALHNQRVAAAQKLEDTFTDIQKEVLGPQRVDFKGDTSKLCNYNKQDRCLSEYQKSAAVIARLSRDNRLLIERYHRLYRYPHYREVAFDSAYLPLFGNESRTSDLVRADIALRASRGDTHTALQALARDSAYFRMVLRESRTLIAKMVATARLERNMKLLSELISTGRLSAEDRQLVGTILTPLTPVELDTARLFHSEFAYLKYLLERISASESLAADSTERQWWTHLFDLFYKRNATVNLVYDNFRSIAQLSGLPPDKLAQELASGRLDDELTDRLLGWHTVYNPVGKLSGILMPIDTWAKYISRGHNLDGYMRLVTLQLMAKERGVTDQQMPQFLSDADRSLKSPYTGEPAQWDEQQHRLFFPGLQYNKSPESVGPKMEVFTHADGK